jgi:hypothetical protein
MFSDAVFEIIFTLFVSTHPELNSTVIDPFQTDSLTEYIQRSYLLDARYLGVTRSGLGAYLPPDRAHVDHLYGRRYQARMLSIADVKYAKCVS